MPALAEGPRCWEDSNLRGEAGVGLLLVALWQARFAARDLLQLSHSSGLAKPATNLRC
jgi:hypothetical protein